MGTDCRHCTHPKKEHLGLLKEKGPCGRPKCDCACYCGPRQHRMGMCGSNAWRRHRVSR